ncbi:MAG: hypothetical protein JWM54_29 [Acidobacteriaceae bacterium]|nr:hypothetical protein [Acidobacteriaceae bacterium]
MRHRTFIAMAALVLTSVALPHLRAQSQEPASIASAENAPQTAGPATSESPNQSTSQITSETTSPATSQTSLPAVQLPGVPETPAAEGPAGQANDPEFRAAVAQAAPFMPAAYASEPFRLRLHNLHTLEDIDIVYRIGDNYTPDAAAQLNYFLRDHNTQDVKAYDPREFDLLHDILVRLNRPDATIDVVCGYRTQVTNERLRASSRGVAEHSQHILGHAIDIQIPGSSTAKIREAALSLNEGGVGYYPTGHFVHVDVGAIRTWTYSPRRHRGHLRHAAHRGRTAHRRRLTHAAGV